MAMMMKSGGGRAGRRGRGGGGRHAPMSEINVTPMVDVMLVLLIIFMVAAPLLITGVPLELPRAKGVALQAAKDEPLQISVDENGRIFLGQEAVEATSLDGLVAKLAAIAQTRGGFDAQIRFRAHTGVPYGVALRVLGRVKDAGYHKIQLLSLPEKDGS